LETVWQFLIWKTFSDLLLFMIVLHSFWQYKIHLKKKKDVTTHILSGVDVYFFHLSECGRLSVYVITGFKNHLYIHEQRRKFTCGILEWHWIGWVDGIFLEKAEMFFSSSLEGNAHCGSFWNSFSMLLTPLTIVLLNYLCWTCMLSNQQQQLMSGRFEGKQWTLSFPMAWSLVHLWRLRRGRPDQTWSWLTVFNQIKNWRIRYVCEWWMGFEAKTRLVFVRNSVYLFFSHIFKQVENNYNSLPQYSFCYLLIIYISKLF
jgi:hypothetical protein